MTTDLIRIDQVGGNDVALAGGKAANLGELARIEAVTVPLGFCVTTDAFARFMTGVAIDELLDRLSPTRPINQNEIRSVSDEIRSRIERATIPADLVASILDFVDAAGQHKAWAIRSSATSEHLPTASFAGQHDTYLNVVDSSEIIDRIRRCWASLFTERAVTYRRRNDIKHRTVTMAVIVQQMVTPTASGGMCTAGPLTFDRSIIAVESCVGQGEADVAGWRSLTDGQDVRLQALGQRIEAHFGCPQDIEWFLVDDDFQIVQSRPNTTRFPIPPAGDDANHVYISVGHNQMMTDAIKPLGISLWQMTTPAPMAEAGGRLFVDVTARLAAPASRADFLDLCGTTDPLLRDALQTVLDREGFIPTAPDNAPTLPPAVGRTVLLDADPAIFGELIDESVASIADCRRAIESKCGAELFEFMVSDLGELKRLLFDPRSRQVYMTAMEAVWWLNENLLDWLGENNVADTLTQSIPDNVTSEMGLALLDVADVLRPHPAVVAFLQGVEDDGFLEGLGGLEGGPESRSAIEGFLGRYGMRCAGEIDITRPRWSEQPSTLIPMILAHIKNMRPGEARRRFEHGRRVAAAKEREVLARLRASPGGEQKAEDTKQMIDRVRTFMGYREYPKYGMISRYFIYKQALLAEAERLVAHGVLRENDDIFFLRFEELQEVARSHSVDEQLIDQRKDAFRSYQALTPPRVLTSAGEVVAGTYRRDDVPNGALAGLAVSAGTIEGRARVITDIADADLERGDILVTAYTDPSWTPLFVTIAGLVTEVGGMMTHGSVIAREYGLPAVVGVERATERIRDGQHIRVDGTDGYVIVLTPDAP